MGGDLTSWRCATLRSTSTLRTPAIAGVVLALAVTLALGTVALAHHGWNGYDASQPLNLTGTIREAGYAHPHGFVKLEAAHEVSVVTLALWTAVVTCGRLLAYL